MNVAKHVGTGVAVEASQGLPGSYLCLRCGNVVERVSGLYTYFRHAPNVTQDCPYYGGWRGSGEYGRRVSLDICNDNHALLFAEKVFEACMAGHEVRGKGTYVDIHSHHMQRACVACLAGSAIEWNPQRRPSALVDNLAAHDIMVLAQHPKYASLLRMLVLAAFARGEISIPRTVQPGALARAVRKVCTGVNWWRVWLGVEDRYMALELARKRTQVGGKFSVARGHARVVEYSDQVTLRPPQGIVRFGLATFNADDATWTCVNASNGWEYKVSDGVAAILTPDPFLPRQGTRPALLHVLPVLR